MRIVFMGSPEYAIESLKGLVESDKHQVVAVATQPDMPSGRGHHLTACPVKQFAQSKNIRVLDYAKISRDGIADLKALAPDIIVTVAYGQILSGELIDIPRFGVINAHASLLPKYRGASPIQAAIAEGETQTGVTIMKTDIGLDTGKILLVQTTDIDPNETAGELSKRLSVISKDLLLLALDQIENGTIVEAEQNHAVATICKKLTKSDAVINWNQWAEQIKCQVLSQNPSPVSRTLLEGEVLKVFRAKVSDASDTQEAPGTIVAPTSAKNGVFVQCGRGVLELVEVCLPSGKIMPAKNLVMSNKIKVGMAFCQFAFGSAAEEVK